ncbi:hypothetical protein ABZ128_09410 [Streptomyces sp. NPDC006326]|uniref:hypothetical protein n=1 Tax=Streptomyces sp. NPDC006326 TaxID=3156752 RepID=UPI0033B326E8
MTVIIDGEEHAITPAVWEVFERWYGDKAYRQAGIVADIEATVRAQVEEELRAKAVQDWPGIGLLLEDIADVVRGGVRG